MKLKLITNTEATLSERRNGHLKLVHTLPKEKTHHSSEYIFQVHLPNSENELVQKKGTWKDFLQCVDIIGFPSECRKLILKPNEDSYVLAVANIAPIIGLGNLGEFQKLHLLLPKGSTKAILIANENIHYNKPAIRGKKLQGTFF